MRALQQYQDDQVLTAPPERLIQLLLIRAVSDLTKAAGAEDVESFRSHTRHAQEIITELRCCLNLDAGPIAGQLDQLYVYAAGQLSDAMLQRNNEAVEVTKAIIAEILEGWNTVVLEAPMLRQDIPV